MKTESLLGYVLRISEENGYNTPWHVLSYAGFSQNQMRTAGFSTEKLAAVLGRDAAELEHISYCGISKDGDCEFRIVGQTLGKALGYSPLRLFKPSFCPHCAQESGFLDAFWDLNFVVGCPKHCCTLINKCHVCDKELGWFRPGILKCECGTSLFNVPIQKIDQELAELMSIILAKVHGKPLSTISNCSGFPISELENVPLRSMLVGLSTLGRFNLLSSGVVADSDPMCVANGAVEALRDWPVGYHEFLRRLYLHNSNESTESVIGLRKRFEQFYGAMFKRKRRTEGFEFIRNEFVRFGLEEWGEGIVDKKMLRGQSEYARYISKAEFANQLGVRPITLKNWAVHGLVPMKVVNMGNIKRYVVDSKAIHFPKKADGRSMGVREAAAFVGLPVSVLKSLRNSGHYSVRHLASTLKSFHEKDLQAFIDLVLSFGDEKAVIPHSSISLGKVMLFKFRNEEGKAEFIREVLSHRIEVEGRTGGNLAGLLFYRTQVEQFLRDKRAEAENGTWSLREAAQYLHCDPLVLPALIQQGLIEAVEFSTGKRVIEKSLKDFDTKFVSLARLAKSEETSSRSLQTLCTNQNIPLEMFNRGYGKAGQPFVKREHRDRLSDALTRSKVAATKPQASLNFAVLLVRYLEWLRDSGKPLPRRAGKPNKAAIARGCGFDRDALYSNTEVVALLDAFEIEDRQRNGTNIKNSDLQKLRQYLEELK